MPLSIVVALVLVSQGVVQTFEPYQKVTLIEPAKDADGKPVTEQTIAVGPAASQIAIKQLGTNGGGFFNANSAHPLENPTPLANFVELLSLIVISAALCYTFGKMVGDTRQGWALLAAMLVLFVPFLLLGYYSEQSGNPAPRRAGRRSAGRSAPAGRKHGRQGGPQRDCAIGDLGRRHHGHLLRRGQLDARQLHAAGRTGAAVADARGRGGFRRRRQRAVRHVGLRHHRRVHRRADGRPHARVSGQEDRGLRDEDGRPGGAGHADGRVDRHGGGRGHGRGQGGHLTIRGRTASAKCSTPSPRPATTTAAPSPASNGNSTFYNLALAIVMLVARYWLAIPDAGHRRLAGAEEDHARQRRHVAHAHAAVRRVPGGHGDSGRRVDVHSGLGPGADRRAVDDGEIDYGVSRRRPNRCSIPRLCVARWSIRSGSSIRGGRSATR